MGKRTGRIFVDADACPFKDDIVEIAEARGWGVTMVANYCHAIDAPEPVEVVQVDRDREAVDIAILNRAGADDIVVTQDHGLAALVLGQGSRALSPRGTVYKPENIDSLLASRYRAQQARRTGARIKGPPRLNARDRNRLRQALERLLRD
jgi:uncharacterized protein YaiI (UPF0178 family)